MTTPAQTKLLVNLAGTPNLSGAITATNGQSVALSLQNTAGAATTLWEIYAYPPGWACPSGWTQVTGGRAYQVTTSSGASPPSFTLPSTGTWGKFLLRATVNSSMRNGAFDATLVDAATAIQILGPLSLQDIAPFEQSQFSLYQDGGGWADSLQGDLRTIASNLGAGSGVAPSTTTPQAVAGAGAVGTGTTYARADHAHLGVTSVNGSQGAVTITIPAAASLTPFAVAAAGASGASLYFARADHVHPGVTSVAAGGTTSQGPVSLVAGTNVTITNSAGTVTIAASGGGGGSSPTGTGLAKVSGGAFVSSASTLVDADVSSAAAIAVSKLAPSVTNGYVLTTVAGATAWAAASGAATPTGTGLAKVSGGAFAGAASLLVDADVSSSAAIAVSKLAPAGTNGFMLYTTGGVAVWAAAPTGSYTPPTGTGIPHVIGGTVQSAASLIVDADVSGTAAIAVTKLAASGIANSVSALITNEFGTNAFAVGITRTWQKTVAAGTTAGTTDTTVWTSPFGLNQFIITAIYVRVSVALVGAGSSVITIGSSAGATDLFASKTITSSVTQNTLYGVGHADYGSAFTSANDYQLPLASAGIVSLRVVNSGTITTGATYVITIFGAAV